VNFIKADNYLLVSMSCLCYGYAEPRPIIYSFFAKLLTNNKIKYQIPELENPEEYVYMRRFQFFKKLCKNLCNQEILNLI
jgi:hypothetical protein